MNRVLVAWLLAPAAALAQTTPAIPIRELSPTVYRTTEPVGIVRGLKQLPDGRVLANLVGQRRVLAFDSTLSTYSVVIDSAAGLANSYPPAAYPFARYRGDTVLLIDMGSRSFLVVEPTGEIGRVMAPPRPQDLTGLANSLMTGAPGFDAQGRLIYRVPPTRPVAFAPSGATAAGAGGRGAAVGQRVQVGTADGVMMTPPAPGVDSSEIIRVDFDTRAVDTLARVKIPPTISFGAPERGADGKMRRTQRINPVPPAQDEWAVLPDGSIAIVRGFDYHIDWIRADGTRESTPKMPFDWRRLTDDDKQAKIDSARRVIDSVFEVRGDVATGFMMQSGPDGSRVTDSVFTKYEYVDINEIADYVPPVRSGSVKPDEDGNLWILPTTSLQARGGLLYDVVNREGTIIERVQLPAGRDLVGFGPGGVVYLSHIDGATAGPREATRVFLERARVVRTDPPGQ